MNELFKNNKDIYICSTIAVASKVIALAIKHKHLIMQKKGKRLVGTNIFIYFCKRNSKDINKYIIVI